MTGPALELVAGGPAWVQDGGRPGGLADGVPPGGPLVPEGFAAANRAVGNPAGAAALECFGGLVVAARGGDLRVAWGGVAAVLPRDHVRTLALAGPVAYLAVAGGFAVPEVLGGRGLLAVAGLGGGVGRALRAGERLGVGPGGGAGGVAGGHPPPQEEALEAAEIFEATAPIRVVAGPDLDRFLEGALADFLGRTWEVGPGDRVGTRLVGAPVARVGGDRAPSAPMVRGAIQVPAGGGPVVLGPDHPTTGGYPVIATVIAADHGALAARPRGASVRFVAVTVDEARAAGRAWRAGLAARAGLGRGSGGPAR